MAKIPLHYIDLRAFCYATEAEERVAGTLRTLLPESVDMKRVETEGHFGDPIVIFSTRVERADEIRSVLGALDNLPDAEYKRILDELDERVDPDCNLFLTLDKQAATNGEIHLGQGISVRGKVEAYPAKREGAIENAREVLEEL